MNNINVKIVETTIREFSHELKNNLTSVKGYLQLIDVKNEDSQKVKEYSTIVQNQIDEIENMVDEIYKIFLIKSSKKEKIDICILIEKILKNNNCSNVFVNKAESFEINADIEIAEKCFKDLFCNALWDYNPGSKIEIFSYKNSLEIKYHSFSMEKILKDNFYIPYVSKSIYKTGLELFALNKFSDLNDLSCNFNEENILRLEKKHA